MSKIYTKTGDKGQTSLVGGTRVPKYHARIEAYGTVDELCSYIGLIHDLDENTERKKLLQNIQCKLFIAESLLATEKEVAKQLPHLIYADIALLESQIDMMDSELPELQNFILPSGTVLTSHAHIARCICRRAERIIIKLSEEEHVDNLVIIYVNRLSDYLFTLARKFLHEQGKQDVLWKA